MKKLLFIIIFIYSLAIFSQSKELFYSKTSNPNPDNELSEYFKKEVSNRLLKKVTFLKNKENVILSFFVNNENKPYHISLNSAGSSDLKNSIEEAFYNYPLENLGVKSIDKSKKYSFQVISKKGSKNIFNCSTEILEEKIPSTLECADLEFYQDKETCLLGQISDHFYDSIDFSIAKTLENDDTIRLQIKLLVDKDGILKNNNSKVPAIFEEELENAIKLFPKLNIPKHLNQIENEYLYDFMIVFSKDNLPKKKDPKKEAKSKNLTQPNPDSNLSVFFKNNLPENFSEMANLNRLHQKLTISFELDKKNIPFNIKTNARSKTLENQIIANFKKYPIEKLDFLSKKSFNSYFIQILSYENDKIIVNADSFIGNERVPIFPGCENSESIVSLKKCFNKGVQTHFAKKFDTSLPKSLRLSPGRKKVYIGFKINKEGDIVDINVRAPHPTIKQEVIKVMQQLPKITPGEQLGEKVNVKYSIPFTMVVN